MARPSREAIDTFMSITGAPEAVAVRKLEEHNSDLNEAVNAHFNEGDGDHVSRPRVNETPVAAPDDDMMDVDDPIQDVSRRSPLSLLSESGNVNPFSLDSHLNRGLFDAGLNFTRQEPFVTHPREVRQIPIEVKDGSETSAHSTHAPIIEDVTGTTNAHGPDTHGPVIIDDDDEEDIAAAAAHPTRPSAPVYDNVPDYGNDIEEEMVRAAIEASKKDAELGQSEQNNLGSSEHLGKQPHMEDAELAHAVSLSMKSAEQEKAICDHGEKVGASNDRFDVGSSSNQDDAGDAEHQPLTRNRPKRSLSPSREAAAEASPATSPRQDDLGNPTQHNRDAFVSDEWGGISSLEHDEAVMLEAAMFGGIPEGPGYDFPRQFLQSGRAYAQRTPRPPSPSLEAQRILREQQDDEYLASLQADQEKELRAKAEAEARRLQEEAAKEAALKEERQREEENRRKLQEEQELEKLLATKEASLPEEPSADDENAITLLVRMPDGSRRGRRFLKSDKLQLLFDFIDIGRAVKPGTYRVVRPYPRRAFSDGESSLTLNELGLTSKQEALFLELI